jgi:hypothetical protein
LVRFGLSMCGNIGFKVISASENSNKFQNPRFWEEWSVEDVITLGPTAQAALIGMVFQLVVY